MWSSHSISPVLRLHGQCRRSNRKAAAREVESIGYGPYFIPTSSCQIPSGKVSSEHYVCSVETSRETLLCRISRAISLSTEPFLKYVKWHPDCAETKKMKVGLGRMPARMTFAFIFAVTLLLPDVTSVSVYRSVETTDTTSASVTSAPKETTPNKYESETNETERDYSEVGLTPLDDSPEFYETVSPVKEENVPLLNTEKEESNQERQINMEEFPEESNGPEANIDEAENLIGLNELDEAVDDALDLIRLLVKRDAGEEEESEDEAEEEDEPKMDTIDEDEFSFSDLPRVFEPLIQAFSSSESGPPSPDDFFSWLPALKDLLEPNEEPSASRPTGLPSNSMTHPARRSSPSTFPEPSLQIAPASPPAEPTESEVHPSPSLLEELTTPVPPTIPVPPQPSQPSLSDAPDAEEMFY
ncbi:proline-, glutamic acid- and leucine-rich protein 1-like [Sceloporus undulatus]|uniref:proline-, glutamic acid- and leucine-rich protein 1-like n=1 Tax=Sceloporus undulatus TaxID=8520 RepID=UPI001C4C5586|nr:proline-, glutamic acid- and leucine-rich protein 1-like [Sceloporus undulatus]